MPRKSKDTEPINMFEGDTAYRPPVDQEQPEFGEDGSVAGLFSELDGFDASDHDPVKSTEQLTPEQAGDAIIEEMGPPRRITGNNAGVASNNALSLVEKLYLAGPAQTRCILAGTFIFGDFILAAVNLIGPAKVTISTLSYSAENVDALYTGFSTGKITALDFIISGFFYGHYRYTLWRMLVTNLPRNACRYAVADVHSKVCIIEPVDTSTPTWVVEGSANLRSSQNVEQMIVAIGDKQAVDFHRLWIDRIISKFALCGRHSLNKRDVWQHVTQG
jgi:hypothetical protein